MAQRPIPEILQRKIVARSRLLRIEAVDLRFSNGVERQFERMQSSGRGAVMVVPFVDATTMVLVREYAAGLHDYQLGFPKGLIDPGETPEQAANRELKEEIGYGAEQLIPLKSLTMAPQFFSATMHIFIARNLYQEHLEGDEPEPLEPVHWQLSDAENLLAQEDFTEARSIAALLMTLRELERDPN
ncbi:ADP compounds hydrolase NudE [Pseudidiomarina piscicola]|uniref:ADP compounds hydrolase NudE n=1 Tax=Pseudidiomarina piscicola TaxID=2614830 RepID=A0A6S6WMN3_9GAMM|nr:ADP compounds hydrolase NudE [Pseudidiomarina piscicola]CAB0150621.1 ADP compounds hydrolase NudE [Pseudidiomarina piscicola]VZT40123.1 ADP compounds hydrolase NudE [Pseudomonas aeruginosa]